jgi:hypothetical protein
MKAVKLVMVEELKKGGVFLFFRGLRPILWVWMVIQSFSLLWIMFSFGEFMKVMVMELILF